MKDEKNKIIDEKEETVKIEQSVDGNEELENKMKEKDKNSEEKFEESNLDNIESTENKDENTKEEVAEIRCCSFRENSKVLSSLWRTKW